MRYLRLFILLSCLLCQYVLAQEDLCTNCKVVLWDDFEGNDPNEPENVCYRGYSCSDLYDYCVADSSMVQCIITNAYVLTKKVGNNQFWWHLQDDHTFPNDYTRGYMLRGDWAHSEEVGDSAFYSATIKHHLKRNQRLQISAYVVNIMCYETYILHHPYFEIPLENPSLRFVLVDSITNLELASYSTGDILYDSTRNCDESAEWQLVTMEYEVPANMTTVMLKIYRDKYDFYGNDFAIDDIEVQLCDFATILAPDTVCVDTKNTFVTQYENIGYLQEPLSYQWYFSSDSISWEAMPEGNDKELKLKAKPKHTGWYKVKITGATADEEDSQCVVSDPFKLFVIDDCPPIQCEDGILLFREDFGGEGKVFHNTGSHEALYTTTIEDLCAGTDLSFIAHVSRQRMLFRLTNADTGEEVGVYETGDIPFDDTQPAPQWHQVGMNYRVQEGVSRVTLTIYNNAVGNTGNDFAIEDVEVRLCLEPVTIKDENPVCRKQDYTLQALYDNYGILESPEYQWTYSPDSLSWNVLQLGPKPSYTIPVVHKSDEGWYRVVVADEGNTDKPNCRTVSEPFRLQTAYCNTAVLQPVDTAVCDTLMPVIWRGHLWENTELLFVDTLRDFEDDDSLYLHLSLDTFYCEKQYPIIVNKYNWQLLLDNVAFKRIFPDRQPATFQWYKDSRAIPDATNETYSEEKELMGAYQLAMTLDNGQYVKSNIIHIRDTVEPEQVVLRIYNSSGMLVGDPAGTPGFYLYYYREGDRVWTEKKIIR